MGKPSQAERLLIKFCSLCSQNLRRAFRVSLTLIRFTHGNKSIFLALSFSSSSSCLTRGSYPGIFTKVAIRSSGRLRRLSTPFCYFTSCVPAESSIKEFTTDKLITLIFLGTAKTTFVMFTIPLIPQLINL